MRELPFRFALAPDAHLPLRGCGLATRWIHEWLVVTIGLAMNQATPLHGDAAGIGSSHPVTWSARWFSCPNCEERARTRDAGGASKAGEDRAKLESAIEQVSSLCEVAMYVLGEAEGVVGIS